MKLLEKIANEQEICRLLFTKGRDKKQNKKCFELIMEYQRKYQHPFPISAIDKYQEQKQ